MSSKRRWILPGEERGELRLMTSEIGSRGWRKLKCEGYGSDLRADRVPRSVALNDAGDDDEAGESEGEGKARV